MKKQKIIVGVLASVMAASSLCSMGAVNVNASTFGEVVLPGAHGEVVLSGVETQTGLNGKTSLISGTTLLLNRA